jgi:hypothetical protein
MAPLLHHASGHDPFICCQRAGAGLFSICGIGYETAVALAGVDRNFTSCCIAAGPPCVSGQGRESTLAFATEYSRACPLRSALWVAGEGLRVFLPEATQHARRNSIQARPGRSGPLRTPRIVLTRFRSCARQFPLLGCINRRAVPSIATPSSPRRSRHFAEARNAEGRRLPMKALSWSSIAAEWVGLTARAIWSFVAYEWQLYAAGPIFSFASSRP